MDNTIGEQIEALRLDCERQEVYYKTMISTYEVTSGQQVIQIQKLEKAVKELKIDSANRQTAMDIERKQTIYKLTTAQKAVEDNVQTILRLQMELRTADAEMDSLLEQNEILYGSVESLQEEVKDLGQVKNYLMDERDSLFNALIVLDPTYVPDSVPLDVQEEHTLTDDSLILQYTGVTKTPVPYPYTNPIREVPEYSKVHIPV